MAGLIGYQKFGRAQKIGVETSSGWMGESLAAAGGGAGEGAFNDTGMGPPPDLNQ